MPVEAVRPIGGHSCRFANSAVLWHNRELPFQNIADSADSFSCREQDTDWIRRCLSIVLYGELIVKGEDKVLINTGALPTQQ